MPSTATSWSSPGSARLEDERHVSLQVAHAVTATCWSRSVSTPQFVGFFRGVGLTGEKQNIPGYLLAACAAAFVLRLVLAMGSASGMFLRETRGVPPVRGYRSFTTASSASIRPHTVFRSTPYCWQPCMGDRRQVPAYLLLNAFLGTAAVALIYFLCRRLVNEHAARISLLLSVPNPFLMAHSGDILTENLYVPLSSSHSYLGLVAATDERGGSRGPAGS